MYLYMITIIFFLCIYIYLYSERSKNYVSVLLDMMCVSNQKFHRTFYRNSVESSVGVSGTSVWLMEFEEASGYSFAVSQ